MIFREDALAGQHIIISGGAGAIGIAVVKHLTAHGARMTVNDVVTPDEAQARLNEAGVDEERVAYVQADLTNSGDVQRLVQTAQAKFGAIHTALCHTGMVQAAPLLEYKEETWDKLMSVNLKTAFLLGQASARAMLED